MLAPSATCARGHRRERAPLAATGLNVPNLSYGVTRALRLLGQPDRLERAGAFHHHRRQQGPGRGGQAAGNDAVPVGGTTAASTTDYLNLALKGWPPAIYVGALNTSGSTTKLATLASYSNTAGSDAAVQSHSWWWASRAAKTGLYRRLVRRR